MLSQTYARSPIQIDLAPCGDRSNLTPLVRTESLRGRSSVFLVVGLDLLLIQVAIDDSLNMAELCRGGKRGVRLWSWMTFSPRDGCTYGQLW